MSMTLAPAPIATVKSSERSLTALDRCDVCRAQAWHRAVLADTGLPLYFCAHHGAAHIDELLPQCSEWHDETEFIVAKPDASA